VSGSMSGSFESDDGTVAENVLVVVRGVNIGLVKYTERGRINAERSRIAAPKPVLEPR